MESIVLIRNRYDMRDINETFTAGIRGKWGIRGIEFYFYNKGVVKRLKFLSGTVSSSSNARH